MVHVLGGTRENVSHGLLGGLQKYHIGKILVPVDGSESSNKAVGLAAEIASRHDSEICLVYLVPTSIRNYCLFNDVGNLVPVCTMDEVEEEGEQLLSSALTWVKGAGVRGYAKLWYGRPANRIVQVAGEENFDLIVIGNDDYGIIARLLFGSVSNEVIHKAPCPVLLVRAPVKKRKKEREEVPYESSDQEES